VTTRLRRFFDRLAAGLQYLFCHGAHLVRNLDTHFQALRHLSLNNVIASSRVFPFIHCENLTSLALESEDICASTGPGNLNDLLQDPLRYTSRTLEGVTLRSGSF